MAEEDNVGVGVEVRTPTRLSKFIRNVTILTLASLAGYGHYRYVPYLFENYINFSLLSGLEREMSLYSEMGFYYSYYKTVVEEPTYIDVISKLMNDKIVEYPKEVNAFNRFNIHPEVIIGSIYRYFELSLDTPKFVTCHLIDRGKNMSTVESCMGVGTPIYFYLEVIWLMAGLLVLVLFIYATALSGTILAGLLAVSQYLANHSVATRVQRSPNQRENFALPLLLLQAFLVSMQLRERNKKTAFVLQLQISVSVLNCLCLLFWQFSQFVLLTQIAIFFVMEQLRVIDIKSLTIFLHSHFFGLHMATLLLHGNDMLETSLYTSFFFIVSSYVLLFSSYKVEVVNRLSFLIESWLVIIRICLVICGSICLKKSLSSILEVEEDGHIWDLFYSKLTNRNTFHTFLYICTDAFDFMTTDTVIKMTKTLLLPLTCFVIFNIVNTAATKSLRKCEIQEIMRNREIENDDTDSGIEENRNIENNRLDSERLDNRLRSIVELDVNDKIVMFLKNIRFEPAIFYTVSQMVVFGLMALLVMRLNCLFVPLLCVVSSLVVKFQYYTMLPRPITRCLPIVAIVCLITFGLQLFDNVYKETAYLGDFRSIYKEELLLWIEDQTSPMAAFAGSMPLMATVMLSNRRPIVLHPHYEHLEARKRAYSVYKAYGKFTPSELYQELTKLNVTYLIIEYSHCYGNSDLGCSFEDIWDLEAPHLKDNPLLCRTLLKDKIDNFYAVFENDEYTVFRIYDFSVRSVPVPGPVDYLNGYILGLLDYLNYCVEVTLNYINFYVRGLLDLVSVTLIGFLDVLHYCVLGMLNIVNYCVLYLVRLVNYSVRGLLDLVTYYL